MRRRLTAEERERQLILPLRLPLYPVAPQQLRIDGPLPEAMPLAVTDGRHASLIHATGDAAATGKAWTAVLRVHGEIVWQCLHLHRSANGAVVCSWQARNGVLAYADPVSPGEET